MGNQTKNILGQLLDIETKNFLTEILVTVILIQPRNLNDRHKYQVTATVKGFKPELSGKSHILKLSETLSGQVFVYIVGMPNSITQTNFSVNLQDSVWNNLEWFQTI